jgi:UDP-glucose 4-epimerase
VFGDGTQSRCFGWVGDVVGALVKLSREPKAYGQVFNIGNDKEISIEALAGLIRDRIDRSLKIEHIPYEKAYEAGFEDMQRRVPDLRKIKALIGYQPTLGVEQIIDRVIEFERSRRST